jgi:exodeoxyribonuclease VIII
MNNYAYLIKAKAKSTDAKSQFYQFPAKSDSRAEREILNILADARHQAKYVSAIWQRLTAN